MSIPHIYKVISLALPLFYGIALSTAHAQGPITEGEGPAIVQMIGSDALVYVDGNAGKILFDGLRVKETTPPYSTSTIKKNGNTQCTRNDDDYSCLTAVKNLQNGSSTRPEEAHGGAIDGGGSQTITEGKCTAMVQRLENISTVYLDGEAAQVLFEALRFQKDSASHSTSVVRHVDGLECTKNGNAYDCILSIANESVGEN